MKNPIWNIIILLILTFGALSLYSFSERQISIFDIPIEKSSIKEALYHIGQNDTLIAKTDSIPKDTIRIVERPTMDTTSQRILLIGDSMLEGLMLRLKEYVGFNHHELKVVIWYSSSTKWFGSCDTLAYFIKNIKPTYIMLVVGANELFVRNIETTNQKYVEHIVKQLDKTKFIWIGPPNWKEDTGINNLILKNVGEDRYFPSKNMKLARFSDGAHPTHDAAAIWMDSVATWIAQKSRYPFLLTKPAEKIKYQASVTILQPK
jgi:hypothetical protein